MSSLPEMDVSSFREPTKRLVSLWFPFQTQLKRGSPKSWRAQIYGALGMLAIAASSSPVCPAAPPGRQCFDIFVDQLKIQAGATEAGEEEEDATAKKKEKKKEGKATKKRKQEEEEVAEPPPKKAKKKKDDDEEEVVKKKTKKK